MIFYEAPGRVHATLVDLAAALGGDRPAVLARELTKMFEERVRGSLTELAEKYQDVAPRGECTLVIGGATETTPDIDLDAEIERMTAAGLGAQEIAAKLALATGKPRRQLYQLVLRKR